MIRIEAILRTHCEAIGGLCLKSGSVAVSVSAPFNEIKKRFSFILDLLGRGR
jgi:hypothetical protein